MEYITKKLKSREAGKTLKIQTSMLKAIHDFMHKKGLTQIMPVIVSPITDPLCHSVFDAEIKYYGQQLTLTKSMLLHKQISLIIPGIRAIYAMSPNVRLEKKELGKTGKHLIEFSQVDFEFKDAAKEDVMRFMEELIVYIITTVKKECREEMGFFGRKLKVPKRPFKKFYTFDVEKIYGKDFEGKLSKKMEEPFWLLSHEREFYDREDPKRPGTFLNYDLIYPEGFGEALSGGEREHEYEQILRRMERKKMDLKPYAAYLEFAKKGLIPKSAGAGFGVERLVRFLTGKKHIGEVSLFAKVPGEKIVF